MLELKILILDLQTKEEGTEASQTTRDVKRFLGIKVLNLLSSSTKMKCQRRTVTIQQTKEVEEETIGEMQTATIGTLGIQDLPKVIMQVIRMEGTIKDHLANQVDMILT